MCDVSVLFLHRGQRPDNECVLGMRSNGYLLACSNNYLALAKATPISKCLRFCSSVLAVFTRKKDIHTVFLHSFGLAFLLEKIP
jgi:hypothetical protein